VKFGQNRITFEEANRRFAELQRQRDDGAISEEAFDAKLEQLLVLDDQERWWSKSRSTGEWHYYDGNNWVKATPPGEPAKPSQESASIHVPSMGELLRICAAHQGRRYYVLDAIPNDVLARARSRFPIPDDKRVAALVGLGPMGIAGFGRQGGGIAICEDGVRLLRWHPDVPWVARQDFLEWRDYAEASIEVYPRRWRSVYNLKVGEGNIFIGRDVDMDHLELAELLREIQALITTSSGG